MGRVDIRESTICLSTNVEKVPGCGFPRPAWGSSSVGRARALQARGGGIVALLLHHRIFILIIRKEVQHNV